MLPGKQAKYQVINTGRSGTNIAAYCEPHVTLVVRIDTVHSMTKTLAEKKRWT